MSAHNFPRPFRHPSDRKLRGPVPASFEEFYRAQLRYLPGARLRTAEVGDRYQAWALGVGAPSMSSKAICRAMTNIGHQHFRSNQMHFADAQLATEAPDLADNFPAVEGTADASTAMLSAIDRIQTELTSLRRTVAQSGQ